MRKTRRIKKEKPRSSNNFKLLWKNAKHENTE
jgi:hypothetical protein